MKDHPAASSPSPRSRVLRELASRTPFLASCLIPPYARVHVQLSFFVCERHNGSTGVEMALKSGTTSKEWLHLQGGRCLCSERKHFSVSAVRMCGSRPSSLVRSDVREPLHAAAAFEGSFARRINVPGYFSPASGSYTRPRLLRLRYHL